MTKLSKRQIAAFAHYTTEKLSAQFDAIGTCANDRVKSGRNKGQIKIKFAKYGDLILAEIARRRAATS